MKNEDISILVRCQYNSQTDIAQVQIVRVDTAEKIRLRNGYFVLQISLDDTTQFIRCLVRHIPSGEEVYLQSGPKIRTFFETHLLDHTGE